MQDKNILYLQFSTLSSLHIPKNMFVCELTDCKPIFFLFTFANRFESSYEYHRSQWTMAWTS